MVGTSQHPAKAKDFLFTLTSSPVPDPTLAPDKTVLLVNLLSHDILLEIIYLTHKIYHNSREKRGPHGGKVQRDSENPDAHRVGQIQSSEPAWGPLNTLKYATLHMITFCSF